MNKLYLLLGQITYSYSMTDLLICNIAHDTGLAESPYHYFAKKNIDMKVKKLVDHLQNKLSNRILKSKIKLWHDTFSEIKTERNNIIHSIILSNAYNDDNYLFFNYFIKQDEKLEAVHNNLMIQDIEEINKKLIDFHNETYKLREEILKHLPKSF